MKLITGLILILTMLFTGCSNTDADTPEAIYTTLFTRSHGNTGVPDSFSAGFGEFYEEAAVTNDRPHRILFTQYTADGNTVSETSFELPGEALNVSLAYLGERGVYLIHTGGFENDPRYLQLYSREGDLLSSVTLADVKPELVSGYPGEAALPYQYNLPMAETDGGIALLWGSYVLFLGEDFSVTGSVRLPSSKAALFHDGGLRAVYVENDIPKMASVDENGITDVKELPARFSSEVILAVRDGVIYAADSVGVFRWSDGMGKTPEEFCTLTPSGINGMRARKIHLLFREGADCPDLQVFHDTGSEYRYTWMTKDTDGVIGDRVTVTIASRQPDRNLAQYIIDFNQSQSEIRAVLIDYSVYSTAENPDGAWMKFRMDLETGILKPDLIASFSTDNRELLRNMEGYFTDLTQLMAQYPEAGVTEDNVWQSVLTAYSDDGKLLALPKSIRVSGIAGLNEYLPDSHWNLEEFLDYAENLPDGVHLTDAMSRSALSDLTGIFQYDSFVRDKNFDCPLYIRLLNYKKSLPKSADSLPKSADSLTESQTAYDPIIGEQVEITPDPYAIYRDGTARLTQFTLLGPGGCLELLNQFGVSTWDEISVIGYPTDHEGGLRCNSIENIFMIPEHCVNRKEAWTFLTYLIRTHAQSFGSSGVGRTNRQGIGILKSETMAYLDTLTVYEQYDKAGNVTGLELLTADGADERSLAQPELTSAVREGVLAIFDSPAYPEYFLTAPFDLQEIAAEEEAAFLSGSGTAESTAKSVQSRAGLYMAEHE